LFETAPFRARLPRYRTALASGASQHTEIRRFSSFGISIGVSASLLSTKGILALIQLNQPVIVDSVAFGEAAFDKSTGAPMAVAYNTDRECP
jgi:hypothetical protein